MILLSNYLLNSCLKTPDNGQRDVVQWPVKKSCLRIPRMTLRAGVRRIHRKNSVFQAQKWLPCKFYRPSPCSPNIESMANKLSCRYEVYKQFALVRQLEIRLRARDFYEVNITHRSTKLSGSKRSIISVTVCTFRPACINLLNTRCLLVQSSLTKKSNLAVNSGF